MAEAMWWRPCLAEAIGTFALVFVGAGSIVSLNHLGGSEPLNAGFLVGVALAHGLAIAVMVTALGHLSGGHFNPAVTVGVLFTRKMKLELGLLYIVFQLLGGIFGAFMLVSTFPLDWWDPVNLGTPSLLRDAGGNMLIDPAKGVLIEATLTFFLVLVVFGVGIDARNHMRAVAGLGIGLTVAMDILMGGYLTGAAMNPARAFGPALLSKEWSDQYVYWAGPILGGIIAGLVYDTAFGEKRTEPKAPEAAKAP